MSIVVIGVNHKTAPVAIREQVAFSDQQVDDTLRVTSPLFTERVILSTCNRTEVYATVPENVSQNDLTDWYIKQHPSANNHLQPHIYQLSGFDAIQHTFRVACGLDSMVLGEPQILGQLKQALRQATAVNATGSTINKLMQHAFAAAKRIRTTTEIGSRPVSVAYAAVSLSKQIFGKLDGHTALLVGAGETIELVGKHLQRAGVTDIVIANRSQENARELALQLDAKVIGLPEISEHLYHADIVISSTAAPLPIIGKGSVESALKKRRYKPMFLVDIAVPRDIEAEVGTLDNAYLYTVDDLHNVIGENIDTRQRAAEQAEIMVDKEVDAFQRWLQGQQQVQIIKQYRTALEDAKQHALDKAMQQLKNGKSPEEALQLLAHTLTNKLGHEPTKVMNQAAQSGDLETLRTAGTLLGLNLPDTEA